ncbi:type III secretion protein HrpB2 [Burkholderia lata]|uniref:type III secretion protein HrpB2 n=1 Tax=Burkholderia lata (strain ATCC 17760 / DSM 23089 / LMG 22485 / NCIMB 9086 / R18194 / 383) TaxID=482957 RepID=UPI0014546BDE|nr:type III secretion protein HrpB2 [Burkholderia lata]VWD53062.1 type III secretion protein HrpB2 [Burkholderia lata]
MIDSVSFNRVASGYLDERGGGDLGLSAGEGYLAESFRALMEQPDMVAPVAVPFDASAAAAKLIREQNTQFVNVSRSMMETLAASKTLEMREIHAQSMLMSVELAGMQLDMAAKMGVVSASKSAIETLMKNQ